MAGIDIGIDLGTSNICVYMRDKGIVINQPAVLAYEKKEKRILAVLIQLSALQDDSEIQENIVPRFLQKNQSKLA